MPAAVKVDNAAEFHLTVEPSRQQHNRLRGGHYPARKPKDKK